MKNLIKTYKEQLSYIFFGVLTTLVNFIIYFLCNRFLNFTPLLSNFIAWFLAVIFAFLTNKFFVFNITSSNTFTFFKEAFDFTLSRALTGALDMILFNFLVLYLFINDMLSKLIIGVIITILNYIVCKFFVFKGDDQSNGK